MSLFYSMVVFSTAWPLLIGGDFEVLLLYDKHKY